MLDYLYSDTINVIIALNKRILDVSGRLSLVSPQPEVLQILKRAGVHNIVKVVDSEAELIRTSEEIIMQTSSFKLADLKDAAEATDEGSEFDALRSEIGSALGTSAPPKAPVEAIVHEQDELLAQSSQATDQDYDVSFQNYKPQQQSGFTPQMRTPAPQPRPAQPQFTPPPPQPRGYTPPPQQPAQFQPRGYTPPPPAAPKTFEPPRGTFTPQPPVPPPSKPQPKPVTADDIDEFEGFESAVQKKPAKPAVRPPEPDHDDFDDDVLDEKKKSPLPAVIAVLVFLAIVAGAGIAYMMFFKGPQMAANKPIPQQQTAVPQIPVEQPSTPPAQTTPAQAVQTPAETTPVVNEEPPATTRPSAQKASRKVERSVPVAPPKKVAKAEPRPSPVAPPVKASGSNQIIITSNPSGGTVVINGKEMGPTPFTWDNPFYGGVTITVQKSGYKELSKNVEFTGGVVKQFFPLEKEAVQAAEPPSYSKPVETAAPAPAPTPAPAPAPAPAPSYSSKSTEPEPQTSDFEPTPTGDAPSSAPSSMAASSGSASTGDPATIFIASIPPVADVYLDGKLIGKTNISELKVLSGTHSMKFVKSGKEMSKDMTFQPGKNPSQMVRLQ